MDNMSAVITIDNLGKLYHIGKRERQNETVFETLKTWAITPWQNFKNLRQLNQWPVDQVSENTIWALKNVSLQVQEGDILGIIGRNGAGKSTLLKILSRITRPTRGRIEIDGRISSLLEVGTGFHRDLTGRENIYLNGVLLGMKKHQVDKKFDAIVSFAQVEPFIDTPVKRYSSGMKVRLAFGVAAHLEPEILIVDEVLAVGDAAFQAKCLGKMSSVSKQGRTVIFVSHNMAAIRQLCSKAIVLRNGQLVAKGQTDEMIDWYLSSLDSSETGDGLETCPERLGNGRLRFTKVFLQDRTGTTIPQPISGDPLTLSFEFTARESLSQITFLATLYNQYGIPVTHFSVESSGQKYKIKQGSGRVNCHIPRLPLPLGRYRIDVAAFNEEGRLDSITGALHFNVNSSRFFPSLFVPSAKFSTALVDHQWEYQP
jgi:lipopolysaccharide transport system ATP-binding protein